MQAAGLLFSSVRSHEWSFAAVASTVAPGHEAIVPSVLTRADQAAAFGDAGLRAAASHELQTA